MVRDAGLKFTRESPGTITVRSVGPEGFRINNEVYSNAIAVTADEVLDNWQQKAIVDLRSEDFEALLERSPEMVLLGTGEKNEFPPRDLMFAFARLGVGLEVMDTTAAARTFNVLVGEGRRVAAVFYPL
jgi:uncharacterized protein